MDYRRTFKLLQHQRQPRERTAQRIGLVPTRVVGSVFRNGRGIIELLVEEPDVVLRKRERLVAGIGLM